MPKKKQTDEQKMAAYNNWMNSDEYAKIISFATNARGSILPIEMGTKDISDKWDTFLKELFELMTVLKVPGRKAKVYEQQYCRTMFLEKCEKKTIDGVTYDITNNTQVEIWNCKGKIVEIFNYLEPQMMEMQLTHETYISWKKELIKHLKEWDKLYIKHIKSGYIEMNGIHMAAMKPLTDILESNLNLHYLEIIEKKKDVPSFRHEALEEKFCQHLTRMCEIFRDFGNLKQPFHIRQMLNVLKTQDWEKIPPLAFYFTPLQNALNDVRQCLLKMNEEGILRCKYIIEDNSELMDKTMVMVDKDQTAQWLAGDQLKQDQFKFLYNVIKIIYDSALRDLLLNEDPKVTEIVIPNLVAYHSILIIKRINDQKDFERRKEIEKAEREGKKVTFNSEEEEKKGPNSSLEESILKKRVEEKMNHSTTSQFNTAAQNEREAQKLEIERYGRMWIWEQYFHPNKKDQWLAAAEKFNHINPHVIQDIEDYILLEGFKGKKLIDVKRIIEQDHMARKAKKRNKSKEEEEHEKLEDKRRAFLNQHLRPPDCWNFFEDDEENKVSHVLRAEAQPQKCYIDGRVEKILEDIQSIGFHLTRHEEVRWKTLRNFTIDIFKSEAKREHELAVEEEKKNN